MITIPIPIPIANPDLVIKLLEVAHTSMSAEEIHTQKISFIYGQLEGRASHAQIIAVLNKQDGRLP
jgi:hypothetical protein